MRRLPLALVVGSLGFAVTLASAASLSVNDSGLGAGSASVVSCDTDGVDVNWSVGSDPRQGYTVASVTVSGIDAAACGGLPLSVSLTGADDQRVDGGGPVTVTDVSMAVPVSGTVAAAKVARIHVLIG